MKDFAYVLGGSTARLTGLELVEMASIANFAKEVSGWVSDVLRALEKDGELYHLSAHCYEPPQIISTRVNQSPPMPWMYYRIVLHIYNLDRAMMIRLKYNENPLGENWIEEWHESLKYRR